MPKSPVEKEKKETQLSFRVERELEDQLKAWALREELPLADLLRKVLRVAAKYESLHVLREASVKEIARWQAGEATKAKKRVDEK